MLVTAVSPDGSSLAIVGRVVWAVLHWNPYNFEKVTTVPSLSLSLSDRPSHRLGLLVAAVSPAGSPVAIARRVV